mgnify:CR=1 FL=1
MGQFAIMVGQLVGFFIMLMVGYGCVRLRFYGQTALDGMCSLLLNVLIPLLVFSNAMAGADRAQVEANSGRHAADRGDVRPAYPRVPLGRVGVAA